MRILVLNGSPKRDKSDTLHITDAFLEGMREVREIETEIIHVIDSNIAYCRGCFVCKKNGGTCVIRDDMDMILEKFLQSDAVIYSFPLYSYGMPANLKVLMDRTMPLSSWAMHRDETGRYGHRYQYELQNTKYLMICGCGYPNAKQNFEGMIRQFELKYPENRTVLTVPESPMFNIPQADPFTKEKLHQLREAGAEYARNGALCEQTLKKVTAPMIPEEIYAQFANRME